MTIQLHTQTWRLGRLTKHLPPPPPEKCRCSAVRAPNGGSQKRESWGDTGKEPSCRKAVSGFIAFLLGRGRAVDQSAGAGESRQVHRAVGPAVPCVRVKCRGYRGKNPGACTGSAILREKDRRAGWEEPNHNCDLSLTF